MSLQRCRELVAEAAGQMLDPQGRDLAAAVQWWELPGWPEAWPGAVPGPAQTAAGGAAEPVLLLHGFDSSFLEFRRLAPLLQLRAQLYVPDLFGFGGTSSPWG